MAKVEIHVPNKSYNGYQGEVKFNRGVAVFEDEKLAKVLAERYGYELVKIEASKEVKEVKEEKPKAAPKAKAPAKRTRKKVDPKAGE
jgi:hypothetical protein